MSTPEEWSERLLAAIVTRDAAIEAEVYVSSDTTATTRFAQSRIHQNIVESTTLVRARGARDGRVAVVETFVGHDGPDLTLVTRLMNALDDAAVDHGWPGLPAPSSIETRQRQASVTDSDAKARASAAAAFVAATEGLDCAGYVRSSLTRAAYLNTAGRSLHDTTHSCALDATARSQGADGVARHAAHDIADIDAVELGRVAARKARASANPIDLPIGDYEVILEGGAARDILLVLATHGFNGAHAGEGRSGIHLGTQQFDESVTVLDDPLGPGGCELAFDMEGSERRRLPLISRGVPQQFVYNRRSAHASDRESTGHAMESELAWTWRPATMALRLDPGTPPSTTPPRRTSTLPTSDASVDDLVRGTRRGLLVSDFFYTKTIDPRTIVVTGMTRNGLWLVEDGEIAAAVQPMRFTQSYPDALAPGAVLQVGETANCLPSHLWLARSTATVTTPAVRLASWTFSRGAAG